MPSASAHSGPAADVEECLDRHHRSTPSADVAIEDVSYWEILSVRWTDNDALHTGNDRRFLLAINGHGRQLSMAIRCSFSGVSRTRPVLRLAVGLGVERELVKPLGVAQEDI